MGRPKGSENKDKPFKKALLMELAAAGENHKALRRVAASLITKANTGDTQAIREVADRVDGKVATPIGGDPDNPVEHIHEMNINFVRPK